MWTECLDILPGSTYTPTLYGLGTSIEEWATTALQSTPNKRLVVVGCSVGASCALEIAVAASERVAALVLIGCKAGHRPDPDLHASATILLKKHRIDKAWNTFWSPLFSRHTDISVIEDARKNALGQDPKNIANGVTVFHTRPSRNQFVAQCRMPVIVVTGEDDTAPGVIASFELSTLAQNNEFHVIPKCGHYVPIEDPQAIKIIIGNVIDEVGN